MLTRLALEQCSTSASSLASSSSSRRFAKQSQLRQLQRTVAPRTRASDESSSSSPTTDDAGERQRQRASAKRALLDAISGLSRGVDADEEDKARVDALARTLEALNPNPESLRASSVNGEWELVYTTSSSILGTNKPAFLRPSGKIYQTIDAETLRAKNRETFPFYNAVEADLEPTSESAVKVQFRKFFLFGGAIKVNAPERARGALDITYVDDEIRVSRGDKGNLFVLSMHDASKRLPRGD